MQDVLTTALRYAAKGWYVFPILPYSKVPYKDFAWKELSTNDPATIKSAANNPKYENCNWALDCEKSNIFVLDVDVKENRNGLKTLKNKGRKLSDPTVITPSSGQHFYFAGVGPSTSDRLGPGLDTRGVGGYVLIPGSVNGNQKYYTTVNTQPLNPVPTWIDQSLKDINQDKAPDRDIPITDLDQPDNVACALDYLLTQAPEAIENAGGDNTTYRVACRLRDFGLSDLKALELLSEQWNHVKAHPPWAYSDLERKVRSAYKYAKDRSGNATADALFPEVRSEGLIRCGSDIVPSSILPRDWLLGHRYLPGYVTLTIAPGGVGKSLFSITESLSISTGVQLTYDKVHHTGPIWIYNAEDPFDELERRIVAAAKHYGVTQSGLKDFFYTSGYANPLVFARYDQQKRVQINEPLIQSTIKEIKSRDIKLLTVDPFIRCHRLAENDNDGVDLVMQAFQRIAAETNCAVSIMHHPSKGDKDARGNMDKARGASSLISAARIAHTLYPMTVKEANQLGIDPNTSPAYSRLDFAKANLGAPANLNHFKWFKKISVRANEAHEDTTGVLVQAEGMVQVVSDDLDNVIIDCVCQFVGLDENKSTYAIAQHIVQSGLSDLTYKALQNKIENLFMFPVEKDGYEWRVSVVAGRNNATSTSVICLCDVLS